LKWLTGSITNGAVHLGFAVGFGAGEIIGAVLRVNDGGASVTASTGGSEGGDSGSTGPVAVVAVTGGGETTADTRAKLTAPCAGVE